MAPGSDGSTGVRPGPSSTSGRRPEPVEGRRGLVLGVESSCDETAAAVVRAGEEIVSSVVASQDARHAPFGGIVPEIASRAHTEIVTRVIERALARAGARPEDLAGLAVTNRPGLLGSLLVGLTAAKSLAWAWGLPLVAVHHLEAHIYAARWAEGLPSSKGLEPPFVALVASGGHTSLYLCEDLLRVRRVGATTDDAAGEAFDKVASILSLGYPGGPAVERAARQFRGHNTGVDGPSAVTRGSSPQPGRSRRDRYGAGLTPGKGRSQARIVSPELRFPRSRIDGRPWDFTFSGLKTAVLYHVRGVPPADEPVIPESDFPAVAAAFQEAAVETLVKATLHAARELGARAVTAVGGVAANSLLRTELERGARGLGLACAFPPRELCTDNAAMVAGRGYHDLAEGKAHGLDVDANARPERAPYGVRPSGGALRREAGT